MYLCPASTRRVFAHRRENENCTPDKCTRAFVTLWPSKDCRTPHTFAQALWARRARRLQAASEQVWVRQPSLGWHIGAACKTGPLTRLHLVLQWFHHKEECRISFRISCPSSNSLSGIKISNCSFAPRACLTLTRKPSSVNLFRIWSAWRAVGAM